MKTIQRTVTQLQQRLNAAINRSPLLNVRITASGRLFDCAQLAALNSDLPAQLIDLALDESLTFFDDDQLPFGIELDMDCIKLMPASAFTPSGFTLEEARKFIRKTAASVFAYAESADRSSVFRLCKHHIRTFLGNHGYRRIGITGNQGRHNGTIDYPQSLQAPDAQALIYHCGIVSTHTATTYWVVTGTIVQIR